MGSNILIKKMLDCLVGGSSRGVGFISEIVFKIQFWEAQGPIFSGEGEEELFC